MVYVDKALFPCKGLYMKRPRSKQIFFQASDETEIENY